MAHTFEAHVDSTQEVALSHSGSKAIDVVDDKLMGLATVSVESPITSNRVSPDGTE